MRVLTLVLAALCAHAKIIDLHDENFEHDTQCTTGATTGDWFVRFCPATCEPEWVAKLNALDAALKEHDSNWINVAAVELATNPELQKRFKIETPQNLLFVKGRMYDFTLNETNTTADFLRNFTRRPRNETVEGWVNEPGRDVGLYIPRGPTWYTPVTDKIDEFFLVVDYRMLSTGLTVLSVALVVIGALVPQEHNMVDADAKDDADKKKD